MSRSKRKNEEGELSDGEISDNSPSRSGNGHTEKKKRKVESNGVEKEKKRERRKSEKKDKKKHKKKHKKKEDKEKKSKKEKKDKQRERDTEKDVVKQKKVEVEDGDAMQVGSPVRPHSSRSRSQGHSRSQDRDRSKDRERRSRSGSRSRGRRRSRSGSKGRRRKERSNQSNQSTEDAEKERMKELEYQRRVREQLEQIAKRGTEASADKEEEERVRQRKAKRAIFLQKIAEEKRKKKEKEAKENKPEDEGKSELILGKAGVKASTDAEARDLAGREEQKDGIGNIELKLKRMENQARAYDMFTDSPTALALGLDGVGAKAKEGDSETYASNWDDHEHYYKFRLGDMIYDRYRVVGNQGRGTFSTVFRVVDTAFGDRELVIKVIRKNELMHKAGLKEVQYLQTIAMNDPENKRHCIRLHAHFVHRNHLCLVFEPMHMNLRELLKKFGGVGLNVAAVRSYAKQLFIALKHLKKCQLLHADLKPDNLLVDEKMSTLKLCDFGSASYFTNMEITPYLVSRFYRAPEIILGLKYDEASDVWAVGCVLYELYTGKICFQGGDNTEMLQMHQEVKGGFHKHMIKRGKFSAKHFDLDDFTFLKRVKDSVTGLMLQHNTKYTKPKKDLGTIMLSYAAPEERSQRHKVRELADLISQCFTLDPSQRLTCDEALNHVFLRD